MRLLYLGNISSAVPTPGTSRPRPHASGSSINLKPREEVGSSHGHFHQPGRRRRIALAPRRCPLSNGGEEKPGNQIKRRRREGAEPSWLKKSQQSNRRHLRSHQTLSLLLPVDPIGHDGVPSVSCSGLAKLIQHDMKCLGKKE